MKLTVVSYSSEHDYHICRDEDGKDHRVDLLVDGPLPFDRQELIGKTVTCEYLYPFVEIAMRVTVERESGGSK